MNTIVSYGSRREDRPDHYGLEVRNGIGINDRLTARIHTGILRELENELKDDRGRFDIGWVEGSMYWEWSYDYSLEASYGLVFEREHFGDNRGVATIGTDSYGLKLNFKGRGWDLSSSYILRDVNTGYRSHTIQGGITWYL